MGPLVNKVWIQPVSLAGSAPRPCGHEDLNRILRPQVIGGSKGSRRIVWSAWQFGSRQAGSEQGQAGRGQRGCCWCARESHEVPPECTRYDRGVTKGNIPVERGATIADLASEFLARESGSARQVTGRGPYAYGSSGDPDECARYEDVETTTKYTPMKGEAAVSILACWFVLFSLFYYTDIGESLRSRGQFLTTVDLGWADPHPTP